MLRLFVQLPFALVSVLCVNGCQSKLEAQAEEGEQYETIMRTGSILPTKVKKGRKPTKTQNLEVHSAESLEQMERAQMLRQMKAEGTRP